MPAIPGTVIQVRFQNPFSFQAGSYSGVQVLSREYSISHSVVVAMSAEMESYPMAIGNRPRPFRFPLLASVIVVAMVISVVTEVLQGGQVTLSFEIPTTFQEIQVLFKNSNEVHA